MAGKKGRKLRHWSDDEKRSICLQTTAPGVSIVQVARRYAMNANLIHKWLKDERFAPTTEDVEHCADGLEGFLPVEVSGLDLHHDQTSADFPVPLDPAVSATRVDLTLSDGRRILVEGPTALCAVLRLVKGLIA